MAVFLTAFCVAALISAIGFKKFVWFISLGYGFAVTGIGIAMLIFGFDVLDIYTVLLLALLMIYGLRLGGYLLFRELKSSAYNSKMKKEINDGSSMKLPLKIVVWLSCALLYACETSPVLFRITNVKTCVPSAIAGLIIMVCGLALESGSDIQKSRAKKLNPNRFVDKGLFRIVRCPNYLGEILFWTGVFVSGIGVLEGLQWIPAVLGYVCIVYIMFGGARRLELRQNRNYGGDPEYDEYVKKVPIIIPLVPLYSVAKYKWLVG